MLDIAVLLKITDSIKGWFEVLHKSNAERNEVDRRALKALYAALHETRLYFRRLKSAPFARWKEERATFERSIETEEKLSRLWVEASIELRDVNHELAERCFIKGEYWSDRDTWSDEDIHKANISLDKLINDARQLI